MPRQRLTPADLELIDNQTSFGVSYRSIARDIGCSHTTVMRAMKRIPRMRKLTHSRSLRHYVQEKLAHGWTPHRIAYASTLDYDIQSSISAPTIRRYYRDQLPPRPVYINARRPDPVTAGLSTPVFGSWELDLTYQGEQVYFIAIECTSRHIYCELLLSDFSMCVQSAYSRLLCQYPRSVFRTVAMDFTGAMQDVRHASEHHGIHITPTPYASPWSRGRVERAIRSFKGYLRIHQDPQVAVRHYNAQRMQVLDGRTPLDVFTTYLIQHNGNVNAIRASGS